MKSGILLFTFISSGIFLFCGAKEKKVEGTWAEIESIKYVTDLEKVEQELNAAFRIGHRVYGSSIATNENSRINYAYIVIDDSTRVYSEKNRIRADVPLTAKVSYVEWKMAFGKKYSRDTILNDVEIALKLETELKGNKEEDLYAVTNIQVEVKNQADFLKYLNDIKLFGKEGKFVTNFQRSVLRHSKIKK